MATPICISLSQRMLSLVARRPARRHRASGSEPTWCGTAAASASDRTVVERCVVRSRDGLPSIAPEFLLLSATSGGSTAALPCRFGLRRPERLDELAESGLDPEAVPLPRQLLHRLAGDELAIPDVRCCQDVDLLGQIAFSAPALGDADGWNVRFGRELNATEDRHHFHSLASDPSGLPVLEGKHLTPFAVDIAAATMGVSERHASRLVDAARTFQRMRLGYRDVASPTNRVTLIAALVPAGTITTHTVFCLKDPLDDECQQYLCAMFNSSSPTTWCAWRVGTHVTTAIVDRLPMPRPRRNRAGIQGNRRARRPPVGRNRRMGAHRRGCRRWPRNVASIDRSFATCSIPSDVPSADREACHGAFAI